MTTGTIEHVNQDERLQRIQENLTAMELQVEEKMVLGQDSTDQQNEAYVIQAGLARAVGWSDERFKEEVEALTNRMQNPSFATYNYWIETFANRSIDAMEQAEPDNDLAAVEEEKACEVLGRLAEMRGWDDSKFDKEETRLVEFIDSGGAEVAKKGRLAKVASGLGALSLAGMSDKWSAKRYTKASNIDSTATAAANNKQEKRTKRPVIAALGLVAAVAGGVALYHGGGIEGLLGHFNHLQSPHAGDVPLPSPSPKASPSPDILQQVKPPSPQHVDGAGPVIKHAEHMRGQHLGHRHGGQHVNASGDVIVHRHFEHLNHHLDTIWEHSRHLLGKKASDHQVKEYVHRAFRRNHLTERQAEHKQIGYKFIMPRVKVFYR